ncbi:hypothetical protein SGRIM119S_02325 [Streptomyces griseorubiginosus]
MINRAAPDLPHLLPLHMTAACLGAPTANPQHRLRVHGAPPILVSNALHDPATGYPWAVSVARQLGRSGARSSPTRATATAASPAARAWRAR